MLKIVDLILRLELWNDGRASPRLSYRERYFDGFAYAGMLCVEGTAYSRLLGAAHR